MLCPHVMRLKFNCFLGLYEDYFLFKLIGNMKQQFSVSTTAPEYKIVKVSRHKLEQGPI